MRMFGHLEAVEIASMMVRKIEKYDCNRYSRINGVGFLRLNINEFGDEEYAIRVDEATNNQLSVMEQILINSTMKQLEEGKFELNINGLRIYKDNWRDYAFKENV